MITISGLNLFNSLFIFQQPIAEFIEKLNCQAYSVELEQFFFCFLEKYNFIPHLLCPIDSQYSMSTLRWLTREIDRRVGIYNKDEKVKYVYPKYQRIQNPTVVPVWKVVKVDYTVPGCPINGDEFYRVISDLAFGRAPKIPLRPVCFECQTSGYECLLQKGEPCLGPVTLGGCRAICLRSKRFCYGCRGPLAGAGPQITKHLKNLEKLVGKKYLAEIMEAYGAEDDFLRIEK